MVLWIKETQIEIKGLSFIFLIGSFSEFCKNMLSWDLGGEFGIFMSYAQCYDHPARNEQQDTK